MRISKLVWFSFLATNIPFPLEYFIELFISLVLWCFMRVFLSSCGSFFTYPSLQPLSPICSFLGSFLILFLQLCFPWASLVAQQVKNQPAMKETWVRSLDWEAPLEKGKATHSSILAWESHGQRNLAGSMGSAESQTGLSDFHFHLPFSLFYSEYYLDRFFQVEKRQRKKVR